MKFKLILFSVAVLFIGIFSSCDNDTTYSEELDNEKALIADYIKRLDIKVVNTMPTVFPWPDSVYYLTKSGLYFRLTYRGDNVNIKDSIITNDLVVPRYIRNTLTVKSDTISKWTTKDEAFTANFNFNDVSKACLAWHEAVSYMKYNNSEAKIIVRSKLDFGKDDRPATPYCYYLKIRIQK